VTHRRNDLFSRLKLSSYPACLPGLFEWHKHTATRQNKYNKEFCSSKSKERIALASVSKVEYSNDYPKLSITQAADTPRSSMENYQSIFFLPIIKNDKD
jgi:hypothetical protein